MKRFFICVIVSIMFFANCFSQSVTKQEAENAAINFYKHQISKISDTKADISIKNYDEIIINNVTAIYAFNIESGGFILTSADKNSLPVLAYSFETNIDIDNLNPSCKAWIDNYCSEVIDLKSKKSNTKNNNFWKDLLANKFSEAKVENEGGVLPLLKTNWSQSYPYQLLCPPASIYKDSITYGGKKYLKTCVTGCVATAMAQIMKYYNYPESALGYGSYYFDGDYVPVNYALGNYDWSIMKNQYGSLWYLDTASAYAVAKINFHAGVSVNMNYSAESSGAVSEYVPDALKQNFKYRGGISYLSRDEWQTSEWIHKLITELDLSRPVYYSGSRTDNGLRSGHAFVVDGYQKGTITSYFHFNWGWAGTDNGYFNIDYAEQQGGTTNSMMFSNEQAMITNILPMGVIGNSFKDCKGKVIIPFSEGTLDDGSGPNICKANVDCEWLFTLDDMDTNVVEYDSLMLAFNYIKLGDNDTIKIYNGQDASSPLIVTLTKNNNYNLGAIDNVVIIKTPKTNPDVMIHFTTANATAGDGWELKYNTYKYLVSGVAPETLDNISLFPNPANDIITINGLMGKEDINIIDITGRSIYKTTADNNIINISDFSNGMYFAVVTIDSKSKIIKFIKN